MNKTKIIAAFAEKAGITKTDAARYFDTMIGLMADNMVDGDGEIAIPDFGRFSIKHVAERQGINPATKEKITIAARDKIVLRLQIAFSITHVSIVRIKLSISKLT